MQGETALRCDIDDFGCAVCILSADSIAPCYTYPRATTADAGNKNRARSKDERYLLLKSATLSFGVERSDLILAVNVCLLSHREYRRPGMTDLPPVQLIQMSCRYYPSFDEV